ncbi:MAG: tetratricopeptide repeat protein [Planctomycetota bacterium]
MTRHDSQDDPAAGHEAHSWAPEEATAWFEGAAWSEGLTGEQLALQQELSCLVDGELDEAAAAHAMVLLEDSAEAREFFDDIQRFAHLHRDLSDPERFEARIAMLGAAEIARAAENIDLAHRLATIFYQLGKAYALAGIEPDEFRERVFESAVPVDEVKTRGRGFVDGHLASSAGVDGHLASSAGVDGHLASSGEVDGRIDWVEARHLLNGRLERIADPIEKGERLLSQAIDIDPSHEESKIYLAYLHGRADRTLRAAALYREVFDTAIDAVNRGHAAMQLGRLHYDEGDQRTALRLWRWITMSGLVRHESRFNLAYFNIGVAYAALGRDDRALDAFRRLLDIHLEDHGDVSDIAALFVENEEARRLFDSRPGFVPRLVQRLPELFAGATDPTDPA